MFTIQLSRLNPAPKFLEGKNSNLERHPLQNNSINFQVSKLQPQSRTQSHTCEIGAQFWYPSMSAERLLGGRYINFAASLDSRVLYTILSHLEFVSNFSSEKKILQRYALKFYLL